jgi:hypothetical protein
MLPVGLCVAGACMSRAGRLHLNTVQECMSSVKGSDALKQSRVRRRYIIESEVYQSHDSCCIVAGCA